MLLNTFTQTTSPFNGERLSAAEAQDSHDTTPTVLVAHQLAALLAIMVVVLVVALLVVVSVLLLHMYIVVLAVIIIVLVMVLVVPWRETLRCGSVAAQDIKTLSSLLSAGPAATRAQQPQKLA